MCDWGYQVQRVYRVGDDAGVVCAARVANYTEMDVFNLNQVTVAAELILNKFIDKEGLIVRFNVSVMVKGGEGEWHDHDWQLASKVKENYFRLPLCSGYQNLYIMLESNLYVCPSSLGILYDYIFGCVLCMLVLRHLQIMA